MGRLFWKFFFFFWLAQLVTSLGVGVAIWALRPMGGFERPPLPAEFHAPAQDRPPPPHVPRPPPPRSPLPPPLPIIAGSLVSLIFAALLAWYFARPIRSLRTAFARVAEGQLETRIGAAMGRRRDELADLGSAFDRMAERLQALLDSQRRLLHDVSHELRSPLARLQAAAELLRQQPERAGEFISRIERDTGRMDRLVGELLTLARLDAAVGEPPLAPLDLGELIEEIAADVRVEAAPRQCRIDLSLADGLTLSGNAELLRRAIENVLRNALHHSPPGSAIEIAAQRQGALILLSIADAGPGVGEQELEAIFAPFHRTRRADVATSGYGLGLAITRRVVQVHGGRVWAENRYPLGGLRVSIELPLAN